jgi:hypothetical protein
MKRSQLYGDFDKDTYDHTKNHLRMMGKDATTTDAKALLEAIVRNNPRFPEHEDIAEVVNAFYSSVHYGSTELRSSTLIAHTRSFNAWLEGRATIRPKEQQSTHGEAPPKADNWRYDPHETLPSDITPAKAKELMHTLVSIYGIRSQRDAARLMDNENWHHYIEKLKARAHNLA